MDANADPQSAGALNTHPDVIFLRISFASCWSLFVTGMPGAGVCVATRGRPSDTRATCVKRGGMLVVVVGKVDGV